MKSTIVMTYNGNRVELERTLESISKSVKKTETCIIIVNNNKSPPEIYNNYGIPINIINFSSQIYTNPGILFNIGVLSVNTDIIILQYSEVYHNGDIISYIHDNLTPRTYLSFSCYAIGIDEQFTVNLQNENIYSYPNGGWINHKTKYPAAYNYLSAMYRSDYLEMSGFNDEYSQGMCHEDDDFIRRVWRNNIQITIVDSPNCIHQKYIPAKFQYSNYNELWKSTNELFKQNMIINNITYTFPFPITFEKQYNSIMSNVQQFIGYDYYYDVELYIEKIKTDDYKMLRLVKNLCSTNELYDAFDKMGNIYLRDFFRYVINKNSNYGVYVKQGTALALELSMKWSRTLYINVGVSGVGKTTYFTTKLGSNFLKYDDFFDYETGDVNQIVTDEYFQKNLNKREFYLDGYQYSQDPQLLFIRKMTLKYNIHKIIVNLCYTDLLTIYNNQLEKINQGCYQKVHNTFEDFSKMNIGYYQYFLETSKRLVSEKIINDYVLYNTYTKESSMEDFIKCISI